MRIVASRTLPFSKVESFFLFDIQPFRLCWRIKTCFETKKVK